ncbi:MAG TPA: DUF1775 domain-containing protein, partial [Ilumatobacteraceae bacterium]|nr:DUF1775 domain-containing protein [Ilumatobacteraceae bacterium]
MSTLHRVATALLSGAGLTVVLPVVARDSVTGVLRSIVEGQITAVDVFLGVAVTVMLLLPCVALWLLIRDLTRFYFHANHFGPAGRQTFTTRFTLTALRLPVDELGAEAKAALDQARDQPSIVRLLVPANEDARRAIDRQLAVYGHPHGPDETDVDRAHHLFEFADSSSRPLLEEVAKLEHGMVRHTLRLQIVVLRYVKALLTLLITAVAIYSADAVVANVAPGRGIGIHDSTTLAAIVLIWAPIVMLAVTAPIRWIEHLLRSDGATSTALTDDVELTFRVSMILPMLPGTTIFFPFVQRCQLGEIRWIDIPQDGSGEELDEPAPAMLLTAALPGTTEPPTSTSTTA